MRLRVPSGKISAPPPLRTFWMHWSTALVSPLPRWTGITPTLRKNQLMKGWISNSSSLAMTVILLSARRLMTMNTGSAALT